MRVWLSRWVCANVADNLARLAEEAEEATATGAEWVVFPESFLTGYTRIVDPGQARETFAALSAAHPSTVFFFGSFSEDGRNRMTVWRCGDEIARYDKVHLFPPNREQAIWTPGDRYIAVDLGERRVGLLNCNDLRFPEQARALRLSARCDTLVVVAWWPWRRDWVWRTLLRARAIENGVWVLGCCVAASETVAERFAGAGCYVFDPHGEAVRSRDDRSYELDAARATGLIVDVPTQAVPVARVQVLPDRARPGEV